MPRPTSNWPTSLGLTSAPSTDGKEAGRRHPKPLPNGQHDVSAWREFVRLRGLKGGKEPAGGQSGDPQGPPPPRGHRGTAELRAGYYKTGGDYLHKETVRKSILEGLGRLFAILHKRLEDELPPISCGTKTPWAIREDNARALQEARREAFEFFNDESEEG